MDKCELNVVGLSEVRWPGNSVGKLYNVLLRRSWITVN